jgi:hypothetical protein
MSVCIRMNVLSEKRKHVRVCVCVYVYACMYFRIWHTQGGVEKVIWAYMLVCTYCVYLHVCTYICVSVYLSVHSCAYKDTHTHTHTHVPDFSNVQQRETSAGPPRQQCNITIHAYIYKYTDMHTHTHTHARAHTHTHTHTSRAEETEIRPYTLVKRNVRTYTQINTQNTTHIRQNL